MGELENRPGDPSRMRISDADRARVADLLRDAASDGRIDFDELDERLDATWSAKTYGDLVPITADLHHAHPAVAAASAVGLPVVEAHDSSAVVLGEQKRQGLWSVPARHTARAVMGTITIDLREAMLTAPETEIIAQAVMGEVRVVVPAHFHVIVDGNAMVGEFQEGRHKTPPDLRPDSPVVRVRGFALMGSVTVVRLPPPGTRKRFLGRF